MTVKELKAKRAKAIADARAIVDAAQAEERDMTAEESQQFDALMAEADKHAAEAERLEKLDRHEAWAAESAGRQTQPDQPGGETRDIDPPSPELGSTPEYRAYHERYGSPEYRDAFVAVLRGDVRALQADVDESGGFVVTPEQFVAELLKAVDNEVFVRQFATVHTVVQAQSLGVPSLDADPADPTWTSEIGTGDEDSTMAFGKRELHPRPLAKRVKVSNKLLRMAIIGAEQLVRDRLAYKFGVTEENAFLNGTGAGQPLGMFVASDDGIPTSRDEATDNGATSVTADGLINAKFKLKGQYWPKAQWIFHRDAVKQIVKLKDDESRYIWRPGLISGQPDRLLDLPYRMSEYAPNTFTANQYVGILGDLSFYWIADALAMTVQILRELYAESNQVGFIGRLETDGMPVLAEAFVRVKLGAGG